MSDFPPPYLGQVRISDQRVLFVYLGQGNWCNVINHVIHGPGEEPTGLSPLYAGTEYRLYELGTTP
jgi:hypothetical protein